MCCQSAQPTALSPVHTVERQIRFGANDPFATIDTGDRGWQRYILPMSEWPAGIDDRN